MYIVKYMYMHYIKWKVKRIKLKIKSIVFLRALVWLEQYFFSWINFFLRISTQLSIVTNFFKSSKEHTYLWWDNRYSYRLGGNIFSTILPRLSVKLSFVQCPQKFSSVHCAPIKSFLLPNVLLLKVSFCLMSSY